MAYILVQDREQILLGPIHWRARFIQSELEDLEVDFIVPPTEQDYTKINDSLEIFKVSEITVPEHDVVYQELAGPFYNFEDTTATSYYTVVDKSIDAVRGNLSQIVAGNRYAAEVAGTKVTIGSNQYTVSTAREDRNQFSPILSTLSDDTTVVNWKFPEGFVQLTRVDILEIVKAVQDYVQKCFDWEAGVDEEIVTSSTVDDLKKIDLKFPVTSDKE